MVTLQGEVNFTYLKRPVATQGLAALCSASSIAGPFDSSTIDSLVQVLKEMELGRKHIRSAQESNWILLHVYAADI
jgi:hypothetical protein